MAATNLSSGKSSMCKSCAARNLSDPDNRAALRAGLEAMWASDEHRERVAQRDNTRQREVMKEAWADPHSNVRLSRVTLGQRHKGPEWNGFSNEDILAIRADPRDGSTLIASDYNVAESMISMIKHRKVTPMLKARRLCFRLNRRRCRASH